MGSRREKALNASVLETNASGKDGDPSITGRRPSAVPKKRKEKEGYKEEWMIQPIWSKAMIPLLGGPQSEPCGKQAGDGIERLGVGDLTLRESPGFPNATGKDGAPSITGE